METTVYSDVRVLIVDDMSFLRQSLEEIDLGTGLVKRAWVYNRKSKKIEFKMTQHYKVSIYRELASKTDDLEDKIKSKVVSKMNLAFDALDLHLTKLSL